MSAVGAAPPNPKIVYQGKPCGRGHDGVRYINGGQCVQCSRDGAAARRRGDGVKPLRLVSRDGAPPHPSLTFQGNPCKHGHGGLRFKSNGCCVWCVRTYNRRGATSPSGVHAAVETKALTPPVPTDASSAVPGGMCATPGCRAQADSKGLWCKLHDPAFVARRMSSR